MRGLGLIVLALAVAGCGRYGLTYPSGTEPDGEATPTPTVQPTSTPSPTPNPATEFVRTLTISQDSVDADLVDFPVLVSFTDAALAHVDFGGHVADLAGADIDFRDDAGFRLDYEFEAWDDQTGMIRAWVRVPLVADNADTVFYLHYGDETVTTPNDNPTGVWNDDYVGVWHLSEDPANDILDSTVNAYDGSSNGGMNGNDLIPGIVGTGLDFDGANDSVDFGDHNDFNVNDYTWSLWVRGDAAPTFSENQQVLWNANQQFQFNWSHGDSNFVGSAAHFDNNWEPAQAPNGTFQQQVWYYVAGTYDGNFIRLYVNGVQEDLEGANDPAPTNGSLLLGSAQGQDRFPGRVDEVRVSTVRRPEEWLAASYANMIDPTTFVVLGDEVEIPTP